MTKSVTFSLLGQYGRLGNCMFQIAATISYAFDTDRSFFFPQWDGFKYFHNLQQHISDAKANSLVIPCHNFHYEKIPDNHDFDTVDLVGFFQSDKYFAKYRAQIHHFFDTWNRNNTLAISKVLHGNDNVCSIHVRRGDYTDGTGYHLLDKEYYNEAARRIYGNNYMNANYILFSDDIEHARSMFNFPNLIYSQNNEIEDLVLMSLCDHNIIANSSYSWWAAELNKNPQKKVVAPAKWFLRNEYDTKDLYQDKWIII